MTEDGSGISVRLRAARERLGWSREELAFRAGVSWSAIAQAESGRRRQLRPWTLSRLAKALGVSVDYLVNGGPTPAMLTHRALLYENLDEFAEGAWRFLLEGIEQSEAVLAMAGQRKLEALRERLGDDADRIELVDSAGHLSSPEAAMEYLTGFLAARLQEGAIWVRVIAEPIWDARSGEEVRLLTRHESLINLVFAGSPLSALCPYDVSALDGATLEQARLTHPQTIQRGETVDSLEFRDPGRFMLEL
jgi:transcriptional regulator with XRE-family HTH domain